MDDQLDNDLKNRIREVFENYEDTSADEGWMLLREKYPEKAKRRPVAWLWWGSVAALLLIFLGILWFKNTPVKEQQPLAINKTHPANNLAQNTVETKKDNIAKNNASSDSSASNIRNQNLADNNVTVKQAPKTAINRPDKQLLTSSRSNKQNNTIGNSIPKNDNTSTALAVTDQAKTADQNIISHKTDISTRADIGNKQPVQSMAVITAPGINMREQTKTANQDIIANKTYNSTKADTGSKQQAIKSMATITPPGINMKEQTKKPNKMLFADDSGPLKTVEKNDDKKVRFGIYAATYFNYAKGSNNQINVGAGVTSDIKLSKNLKLSTGITIAQNTLSYNNQPPLTSAATAPAAVHTDYFLAAQSVYTAATPSFKNYNASLVGLDVPINLKYEFNPQKGDTYISAGLSSGTFINETYTYSYSNPAPFSANISQVQDQSTHQSFNSFYFAKTLNFAFGTGYPLGRNRLIIEPFLKYPLDGLGSQQIKFGAGGLNLKFNFETQKK